MHAKVENNTVTLYPYRAIDLLQDNPSVSFPNTLNSEILRNYNVYLVEETPIPQYNPITEILEQDTPEFLATLGRCKQKWKVRVATPEEVVANRETLIKAYTEATQLRLDNFAISRGYDNILSACTYATSTVPKFRTEGQYCVEARDATWAKLLDILTQVETNTRSVPASYADIEPELPQLAWPVQ